MSARLRIRSPLAEAVDDIVDRNQTLAGQIYFVQSAEKSYSINKSRRRASSYRFEVTTGDLWPPITGRNRAELQCSSKEAFDTDVYLSFALRVAADPAIVSDSLVLGQFHQTEDAGDFSGYPPFEFNLYPSATPGQGSLYLNTATVSAAVGGSAYPQTARAGPIALTLNVWHFLVLRVRFNWSGAAQLQFWLDGTQICNLSGISIGMNDAVAPYWKHGVYFRPEDAAQTITAEFYNFEKGGAVILDRIGAPLPVPA